MNIASLRERGIGQGERREREREGKERGVNGRMVEVYGGEEVFCSGDGP